jgi:hypothetical protein
MGRRHPVPTAGRAPPPLHWLARIALWGVSLFFIVPAASVLMTLIFIHTEAIPLTPEQRAAFGRLTARQLVVAYSHTALGLAGGIFLLRRFRIAFPMLLLSAGITVTDWAYSAAIGQFPASAITSPTAIVTNLLHLECLAFAFILHRRRLLSRTFSRRGAGPGADDPWTNPSP